MADKNLRLNMIMSMVDKLTTPALKVTKQTDAMATKIKATQQELERLGATNKDIEHFRTLKKQASATDMALENARKQTAALGAQLKNTANPTRKMTREFEKATAEVRRLETVQNKERQSLQQVRTSLDKAGVSTRNLNTATRDIQRQSAKYTEQLSQQRNELDAVTKRQAALKKITDRNKNMRASAAGDVIGVTAALYAAERLTAAYGDVANAQGEIQSLGIDSSGIDAITKSARDFSNQWAGTTQADFIRASYDIKSGISSLGDEAVGEFTRIAALTAGATKSATGEMTSLFASGYGIYRKQFDQFAAGTIEGWNQLSAEERDIKFGEYFSAGIASSVKAFKTDGQQMSAAISNLGAAATSANVSFAEQLSILGQLQATMSGSEAATKYRAFLTGAAKASDDLGLSFVDANNNLRSMPDILEELRGHYGDTIDAIEEQELKKAFGSDEAIGLIKLLYPEVDQLKQNIDGMSESVKGGTAVTEEMASAILKGPGKVLPRVMQQISNMTVAVGGLLAPAVLAIGNVLGSAATSVAAFTENFPVLSKFIAFAVVGLVGFKAASIVARVTFSLFSDALVFGSKAMALFNVATLKSNALLAVSRVRSLAATAGIVALSVASKAVAASMAVMTAAQWAFNAALTANPIGLVIVGITALVAAAALIVKNWDSIAGFFSGLWDSVTTTFTQAWERIKALLGFSPVGLLTGAWSGLSGFFSDIWQGIKGSVSGFFSWLGDTLSFNPLSVLGDAWAGITGFFSGLWDSVASDTDTGLNGVTSALAFSPLGILTGAWSGLSGFFSDIWQGVKGGVNGFFSWLGGKLGFNPLSVLGDAWAGITGFFSGLWDSVASDTDTGLNGVTSALAFSPLGILTGAWSGLSGFFSDIWQGVKGGVSGFFSWLGGKLGFYPLSVLSDAWAGITGFFSGLWDSVASDADAGLNGIKSAFAGVTQWLTDTVLSPISDIKDTLGGLWDSVFGEDKNVNVNSQVKAITAPAVAAVPTLTNPVDGTPNEAQSPAPGVAQNRPLVTGIPAPSGGHATSYSYQYGDIVIQSQPGDSAQDIAAEVRRQLDNRERESRQRSRGRLGD